MRVVVSHLKFSYFAGTETYMLTVAQQLERLGHDVSIYAAETGDMSEFAARQGVRVLDSVRKLPDACDAVFAQDAATTYELAERYPAAVRVCTMHSAHNPLQSPPQLEDVAHAVVVLNDRLRRRAEQLAWCPEVVRLRQPVDLKRFNLSPPVGAPRRRPHVILLTNYPDTRVAMLEEAARAAGMELTVIGAAGRISASPEHAIADADIVVSAGRGALEAMAGGRAVYVFAAGGGDGWVTPSTYASFESDGFSGRATSDLIDAARLTADLRQWQPGMGESNRDLIWAHHDCERHAIELTELVERLDARPPPGSNHLDELARLVRLEWYSFGRAETALNENRWLRAEADALRDEVLEARNSLERIPGLEARIEELERANAAARRNIEGLLQTRRYKLACQIARPVDLLRARWRR